MSQRDMFVAGEGAAWLKRNEAKLTGENDPVIKAIDTYKIKPKRVLEIGCANGWRLKIIHQKFKNVVCGGIDPGCETSTKKQPFIEFGTADRLTFPDTSFDVLIYGWCLYLTDPDDYFRIASEGDRILKDGGYLIVYDFYVDHHYQTPYRHKKGLFSHHYDFAKLWRCHPAYSMYGKEVQGETSVTILQKSLKSAFPVGK